MAKRAETPSSANDTLKKLRILLKFAVDISWRTDDPTIGMKKFAEGEHHTWTEEEITLFEERWPVGSVQRTAFALLLYTGQRVSDVAGMSWRDVNAECTAIHVTQDKTGTKLWIPIHADLMSQLNEWPRHSATDAMLYTEFGKPFTRRASATRWRTRSGWRSSRRVRLARDPEGRLAAPGGGRLHRPRDRIDHRAQVAGGGRAVHESGLAADAVTGRNRQTSGEGCPKLGFLSLGILRKTKRFQRLGKGVEASPGIEPGARICSPLRNHSATRPSGPAHSRRSGEPGFKERRPHRLPGVGRTTRGRGVISRARPGSATGFRRQNRAQGGRNEPARKIPSRAENPLRTPCAPSPPWVEVPPRSPIAQLVEQATVNRLVAGSSPAREPSLFRTVPAHAGRTPALAGGAFRRGARAHPRCHPKNRRNLSPGPSVSRSTCCNASQHGAAKQSGSD